MKTSNPFIPVAIIIAGGLIAASLYIQGDSAATAIAKQGSDTGFAGAKVALAAEREGAAHVFGDPNAPIKIVEFSDFECPYCSRVHPTLERIVTESDGKVAWEYRHLPLPSHRNAEEAAYSAECAAKLGGADAFWSFADAAFNNQRQLKTNFFETEAEKLGIDIESFRTCVASDEVKSIVLTDQETAVAYGGRGTPFSVIVYPDGTTRPVSGALPYDNWVQLLNI